MEAVKFIKGLKRMCQKESCNKCPAFGVLNGDCDLDTKNPERLVEIVEQWSQSHPQKTMMQDFFEKFPNAPKRADGAPKMVCPYHVGYVNELEDCDNFNSKCLICWSRPLEE